MNKVTLHGAEYLPGVNGKKRTRFFQMYAVSTNVTHLLRLSSSCYFRGIGQRTFYIL